MPNKFHKSITGIFFSFYKRVNYTFFQHTQLSYEFGKSANSIGDCVRNILLIARNLFGDNLEFAFFGALTSVGALFILEVQLCFAQNAEKKLIMKR